MISSPAVAITYRGFSGEVIAVKERCALAAKDGSYWPRGVALSAYGLDRWQGLVAKNGYGVLVEGSRTPGQVGCTTCRHWASPAPTRWHRR